MKKRLFALLCVITCIFGLTACGKEKTYTSYEQERMTNAESKAQLALKVAEKYADYTPDVLSLYNKAEMVRFFQEAAELTAKEDILADLAQYYGEEVFASAGITTDDIPLEIEYESELGAFDGLLSTYRQMNKEMGGIVSFEEFESEIEGKEVICTLKASGNNCDGVITFTFTNDTFLKFKEGNAIAQTSIKQKLEEAGKHMGDAGLNTLLGMGSVFIVLILISFLISAFTLFKSEPKKNEVTSAPVQAPEATEELTDDTELVAVIMAAISAYESANGGSADGFVVRSIKKANRRI